MDYVALKAEIQAGPLAAELAPHIASGNDQAISDALNRIDAAVPVDRDVVDSHEIIDATVPAEWGTLTASEKQRYQTITGAGKVNLRNPNIRAAFAAMFGAGTETRAALLAMVTRPGSRAEAGGFGAITPTDVAIALRST